MTATPARIRTFVGFGLRGTGKTIEDVETKLPNWACDLIFELARNAANQEETAAELREAAQVADEDIVGGQVLAHRVPRRKYIYVGDRWTSDLRVRFENADRLEVTANGPLQIDVDASNIIRISERRP